MGKERMNKPNPILWFLFVIVIPTIVATTLAIIILAIAGIDVVDWTKSKASNVPLVSKFIKTKEEKKEKEAQEKAQAKIEKQKTEIDEQKIEINNLEDTIDHLNQEILKLENKTKTESTLELESTDDTDFVKKMSASFRKMNKKQAALIFEELEEDIAISILHELPNDVRGGIFEAMEPSKAAKLTQQFINSK